MLFDEYEIYFTSETGFLIFSRVRSTSENIIKILSKSEINSIFINKALNFLFITFLLLLEHVCFKSERFESNYAAINIIIKNMTSQSVLLFSSVKITLLLFSL
jgi:hypothetical protein